MVNGSTVRVQIPIDHKLILLQFLSFLSFIWKKSIVQLSSICQLTLYLYFPEQSLEKINCVTTFEGVYQFSYEVDTGGGGICNHPDSQIKACQEPGSQYVDNEVFVMTYRKCLDVSTSKNERMSCWQLYKIGSWEVEYGNDFYLFFKIKHIRVLSFEIEKMISS